MSDLEGSGGKTNTLLFVTSANVDIKTLNRFLLDSGSPHQLPDADYSYHVVRSRDAATYSQGGQISRPGDLDATTFNNPWIGASIPEIEAFALQTGAVEHDGLFLVLDGEGVARREVVLAERAIVSEPNDARVEEQKVLDQFKKVRVPWRQVESMSINLEVANMGFEEFITGAPLSEEGNLRGGWYQYDASHGEFETEGEKSARQRELERLVEAGLI